LNIYNKYQGVPFCTVHKNSQLEYSF